MLISGLLIETKKTDRQDALIEIKKIKGLEVTEEFEENQVGLVLESKDTEEAVKICEIIRGIPQVKNLNLVYYHHV
ncbi:MAG: chaperone NapD [Spirochaetia bacterium]|nr:chaperone NapD [Spirochaetia bacterium]